MYDDEDQDYCVSYRFQHCEIKKKQQQKPDQIKWRISSVCLFTHLFIKKLKDLAFEISTYMYIFFLQILNVSMSFGTIEVNMIV